MMSASALILGVFPLACCLPLEVRWGGGGSVTEYYPWMSQEDSVLLSGRFSREKVCQPELRVPTGCSAWKLVRR